eukprot:Gb_38270 [translate_table: standard]
MAKQEEQAQRLLHAVVMPFPAQGHVNALMNFAKLLASRRFFIIFINTDWIENRIFKRPDDAAAVCRRLENEGLRFRFLSVPDNMPPDQSRAAVLDEYFQALQKLAPAVEQGRVLDIVCCFIHCPTQLSLAYLQGIHSCQRAAGKSMALPEGFEDRTKDRALLVGWAPQSKVLSHPSVGGFLTHGGWNSILEAIGTGVPMIGWPYFADQLLNCRFAKDVWKIGLDFDEIYEDENKLVRKEEVEKAVRDLMEGQEGKELRKIILKLKEVSAKSVVAGGSSFENLNKFVEDMKKKGRQIYLSKL